MNIERCEDLIDWTRKAHALLADSMAEGAKDRNDSLAKMLLDYLAQHERELAATLVRVKEHAEPGALQTPLHDAVQGSALTLDIDSETFATISVDQVSQEVFALHNRIIDLYRSLEQRRELHKASALIAEVLQLEERETKRLAHQVNRMHEM